jgi:hypothetical protein
MHIRKGPLYSILLKYERNSCGLAEIFVNTVIQKASKKCMRNCCFCGILLHTRCTAERLSGVCSVGGVTRKRSNITVCGIGAEKSKIGGDRCACVCVVIRVCAIVESILSLSAACVLRLCFTGFKKNAYM